MSALADLASILRIHILGIAVLATLVFGWILTGTHPWAIAALVGVDWLLINLFNRVTDLLEDQANGIRGTALVAARPRAFAAGAWAILLGSFAASHVLWPALTPWRLVVQVIGLGYSYRLVPTPRGWKRFKDLYALKNGMSAGLFLLTVLAYPLVVAGGPVAPLGWGSVAALGAFFFLFEQTYEVLYDLRDLEGDRLAGVPTYPVVHGAEGGRRIVDGLLAASLLPLFAGLGAGAIGVREALLLAAPAVQLAAYRPRYRRGLTSRDCILLTHLGSALLVVFLVGTRAWLALGLPPHVFLR